MSHPHSHIHWPDRHNMAVKMEHLVHDERFWGMVGILAFTALIIFLAMIAESSQNTSTLPILPYLP